MSKITSMVLAFLLFAVTTATAQRKMTVEELLKPYDAKPQSTPSPAAPEETPRAPTRAEEERLITWAREAVMNTLKDPASAQFEAVQVKANAVCGFVNARNSYGGYVGRTRFAAAWRSREVFVLPQRGTDSRFSAISNSINIYCGH